jgi:hypothetical protein
LWNGIHVAFGCRGNWVKVCSRLSVLGFWNRQSVSERTV